MNLLEWIRKALTAWRGIFSLLLCVVFSGILVSLEPREREVFHEVMVGTFLYPVQSVLSRMNGTVRIYRENDALKRANAELRIENDLLRQELRQVPRLLELDSFAAAAGMRLKSARVVAQDPGRMQMAWVVDLGRADSLDRNMPVLTSRGVVGKTAKCFRGHSLVQLMSDPAFKASVQDNRSRARGILESYRLHSLVARFPAGADVLPGDTLITAGLGGVFPKGLRVGVLEKPVEEQESDVLRTFLLRPFQELNTVEEVFVLIKRDSWTLEDGEEENP